MRYSGYVGGDIAPYNPTITLQGTGTGWDDNVGAGTITITNVNVPAGGALVVGIAMSDKIGLLAPGTVKWGSTPVDLTLVVGHNNSNFATMIFGLLAMQSGNGPLTVDASSGTGAAVVAFTVTDISQPPAVDVTADSEGTGTDPTVGPLTNTNPRDALIAAIGSNGPTGDSPGTWTDSFTRIGRVGTNAAFSNATVDCATRAVAAISAYSTGKTAMTSRLWAAAMAAIRANPV